MNCIVPSPIPPFNYDRVPNSIWAPNPQILPNGSRFWHLTDRKGSLIGHSLPVKSFLRFYFLPRLLKRVWRTPNPSPQFLHGRRYSHAPNPLWKPPMHIRWSNAPLQRVQGEVVLCEFSFYFLEYYTNIPSLPNASLRTGPFTDDGARPSPRPL